MIKSTSSKAMFTTVVLILGVLIVTPALAQPAGRWIGTGSGSTTPPSLDPSQEPIHPWQEWKADFIDGVFLGVWLDKDENYGQFRAKMVSSTPTTATYKGTWSWLAPSGWLVEIGEFKMTFKTDEWLCYGEWTTNYNSDGGTMEGERTE